jgi:hypothetical protein
MVIPLSSVATLDWFSSLSPFGQGDKGSSPALLISKMEQPFYSINALVLTLSRLAEFCMFKWFGYLPNLVLIKSISIKLLTVILALMSEGIMVNRLCSSNVESFNRVEIGTLEQATSRVLIVRIINKAILCCIIRFC